MEGRRVHLGSGRNYHVLFNPPKIADKDDQTGEPLIQREDDKSDTVKDRLDIYRTQTQPLIKFYVDKSDKGELIYIKVSGSDLPSLVSKKILEKLKI